jgi:hypothetical protein
VPGARAVRSRHLMLGLMLILDAECRPAWARLDHCAVGFDKEPVQILDLLRRRLQVARHLQALRQLVCLQHDNVTECIACLRAIVL